MSEVKKILVFSTKYKIPKIFKYDFDCGSLGLIMLLESTSFKFFIYSLTMFKSEITTTWLVVIIIPLLSDLIKSTTTSNLMPLRNLLMLMTWTFDQAITLSALLELIGMIICLHKKPLVIMLSSGFPLLSKLLMILWISKILLEESLGKESLILIISLMFSFKT